MNSEPLPNTSEEVYVPYKGSVEKWKLLVETDAGGRRIAQGAIETTEDGTAIQPIKSLSEASLSANVQEKLLEIYTEAQQKLGHDALESSGVKQPTTELTNYDNMLNPDYEMPSGTEFAAVRPAETNDERMNRDRTMTDINSAASLYAARLKDGVR